MQQNLTQHHALTRKKLILTYIYIYLFQSEPHPDPLILPLLDVLAFSFSDFPCLFFFLCVFPFFSKDFWGSAKRNEKKKKTCFSRGFPCFFFPPKSKGWRVRAEPKSQKHESAQKLGFRRFQKEHQQCAKAPFLHTFCTLLGALSGIGGNPTFRNVFAMWALQLELKFTKRIISGRTIFSSSWGRGSGAGVSQSVRETSRDKSQKHSLHPKTLQNKRFGAPKFWGISPKLFAALSGIHPTSVHPYFPVAKILGGFDLREEGLLLSRSCVANAPACYRAPEPRNPKSAF